MKRNREINPFSCFLFPCFSCFFLFFFSLSLYFFFIFLFFILFYFSFTRYLAVAIIFFNSGLTLRSEELRAAVLQFRLHAFVQVLGSRFSYLPVS
jgi:predicted Na+-dependent transporter